MQREKSSLLWRYLLTGISIWMCSGSAAVAADLSKEELEAWFEDDSRSTPFSTDHINEGELKFLATPPDNPALYSANRLTISATSLHDGWVVMYQCYENLDAVADAQVVYQYKQLRNLTVEKIHRIEKAWVEGQSVQLQNTQKGATLCVSAEVRILYKHPDGSFLLKNGPFQRRFLDGYYPMHVSLAISYPQDRLTFAGSNPDQQPGFRVTAKPGLVEIDTWFEGRLFTELQFKSP